MEAALRKQFEIGGHKAYWLARLGAMYDVHLVSSLDARFVERFHFTPVDPATHRRHLSVMLARAGDGARVGVMPHAGHTLPIVVPRGGQRP